MKEYICSWPWTILRDSVCVRPVLDKNKEGNPSADENIPRMEKAPIKYSEQVVFAATGREEGIARYKIIVD